MSGAQTTPNQTQIHGCIAIDVLQFVVTQPANLAKGHISNLNCDY